MYATNSALSVCRVFVLYVFLGVIWLNLTVLDTCGIFVLIYLMTGINKEKINSKRIVQVNDVVNGRSLAEENVSAVELLDYRSLMSVRGMEGLPDFINELPEGVAALLIETRAANQTELAKQISHLTQLLAKFEQNNSIEFTDNSDEYSKLWAIRKQTFPAVGAIREVGTTVMIEDVAFPVEKLALGVMALQRLFIQYKYDEAIVFCHALDGNLHFVFTQDFSSQVEIDRYEAFLNDVCKLVAIDFNGSLKAEHGTGRNMAPFIEDILVDYLAFRPVNESIMLHVICTSRKMGLTEK